MTEENKNQKQTGQTAQDQTVSGNQPVPAETGPIPQEQPGQEGSNEVLSQVNREFKERAIMGRAKELGLSYANIEKVPINTDLLHLIVPEMAKKAMIMPFYRVGQKLRIAVADPNNPDTKAVIEDLRAKGYQLNVNLASEEGISFAHKLYESPQYKEKRALVTEVVEKDVKAYEEEVKELSTLKEKIEKTSSEEALNLIDVGAMKAGASDIHYEPEEKFVRVRFRIDGILHEIFELDKGIFTNIGNQIKYKAKMKLNITNVPQDGRYSFLLNGRKVDVRVSVLPTEYGETFVCRLLDSGRNSLEFEDMGFVGRNLKLIQDACLITNGMILVTGPTGSGKSTTLYSLLAKFSKPENKVITLEDPIEYHLPGISQSQVNEKREYTFAGGLRAILRQDPDIVMLGEIRDLETAETAAQAALTGHVLLSTLHTNSVLETSPRLVNMGLPEFMIAPALNTIVAQRLARRLCPDCREEKVVPESERAEFEKILAEIKKIQPESAVTVPQKLFYPKGCDKCSHTGYKGRIQVIEILTLNTEIKDLILEKAPTSKLHETARKMGMTSMEEDGILKVLQGITTLEEIHRVTRVSL